MPNMKMQKSHLFVYHFRAHPTHKDVARAMEQELASAGSPVRAAAKEECAQNGVDAAEGDSKKYQFCPKFLTKDGCPHAKCRFS